MNESRARGNISLSMFGFPESPGNKQMQNKAEQTRGGGCWTEIIIFIGRLLELNRFSILSDRLSRLLSFLPWSLLLSS
jgi:hypothetical protein